MNHKFPNFDYTIVTYKKIEIIFKQSTLSTIDDHYKKKDSTTDIDNLLNPKYIVDGENSVTRTPYIQKYQREYQYSLIEIIIHGILGKLTNGFDRVDIVTNANKKISKMVKKRSFNENFIDAQSSLCKKITVEDIVIKWEYIYESGKISQEQSTKKIKEKGILYRNREEIEKEMNICFEDSVKFHSSTIQKFI